MQPSNVIVLLAADTCDEADGGGVFSAVAGVDGCGRTEDDDQRLAHHFDEGEGQAPVDAIAAPDAGERFGREARVERLGRGPSPGNETSAGSALISHESEWHRLRATAHP